MPGDRRSILPERRTSLPTERIEQLSTSTGSSARERILETAYELFSRESVRAVGVDCVIAGSGVAKMTLYRNFASRDELVLEFLRRREKRWTRG